MIIYDPTDQPSCKLWYSIQPTSQHQMNSSLVVKSTSLVYIFIRVDFDYQTSREMIEWRENQVRHSIHQMCISCTNEVLQKSLPSTLCLCQLCQHIYLFLWLILGRWRGVTKGRRLRTFKRPSRDGRHDTFFPTFQLLLQVVYLIGIPLYTFLVLTRCGHAWCQEWLDHWMGAGISINCTQTRSYSLALEIHWLYYH